MTLKRKRKHFEAPFVMLWLISNLPTRKSQEAI